MFTWLMKKIMIVLIVFGLFPSSIIFAEDCISCKPQTISKVNELQNSNIEARIVQSNDPMFLNKNTQIESKDTTYVNLGRNERLILTTKLNTYIVKSPDFEKKETTERGEIFEALTELSENMKLPPAEVAKTDLYKKIINDIHWKYNGKEIIGYFFGIPFSIVVVCIWFYLFKRICLFSKQEIVYDEITNKPIKVINYNYNDELSGNKRSEIYGLQFIFGLVFFIIIIISCMIIF